MRPDRASCAICMETLFNKLDDLDDVVPIVAPGCGHVFHESCLHQWFDSQASSYIAAMRAQGSRESSPTASEAPAECPTCRQECFMDENSKYETTRLYINWGEQDGSSVAGSSPVRPHTQKARRGPNELLGLARRAKGLAEEAGDQSADSQMADVQSMLHRSEGLRKDLEEQQEKGVEGIRRYVGGLTAAINKLSTNLVSNPTSAALQMQLAAQEHKVAEQERRIHDILNRVIPDQIAAAKREEKKKGDHHYAKLKKDLDTLEQELQQEKVARRNLKKGMVEKFELMEAKVDQAKKDEERERRCRESLQADLNERTMQLRALQAKTKSRKDLATELKDVRAELAALKEQNTELSKRKHSVSRLDRYGSSSSSPSKRPRLADIDNFDGHDKPTRPPSPFLQRRAPDEVELSIQELSPTTYSQLVSTGTGQNHRSDPLDESLQIDMESFDRGRSPPDPFDLLDSLDNPIRPQQKAKSAVRGNTTARSFTSDQFAGPSRRAAVPISRTGSSSSKYFTNTADRQSESKTNPFSSTKADTEKRKKLPSGPTVMVPSSSDNEDTQAPPSCRPARQDFTLSSTNPARAVLRTLSQPTALSSRPKEAVRKPSGQPSIVAALGLADKNGRPMKGLAMGARAGRRA